MGRQGILFTEYLNSAMKRRLGPVNGCKQSTRMCLCKFIVAKGTMHKISKAEQGSTNVNCQKGRNIPPSIKSLLVMWIGYGRHHL
jgi:hypothetical protein